jgi:hypothetical protein
MREKRGGGGGVRAYWLSATMAMLQWLRWRAWRYGKRLASVLASKLSGLSLVM